MNLAQKIAIGFVIFFLLLLVAMIIETSTSQLAYTKEVPCVDDHNRKFKDEVCIKEYWCGAVSNYLGARCEA